MGDRGAVRLRQVMEPGLFLAALALCGWYEAAMAPFRVASSATTFSTGAAVLALGAVRNRRTRPAGYREEVTTKAAHHALAHRGAVVSNTNRAKYTQNTAKGREALMASLILLANRFG